MAYSEQLANSVRGLLSDRDDVAEVAPAVEHAETRPPKQPKRKAVPR
jgi:hypothetical protein